MQGRGIRLFGRPLSLVLLILYEAIIGVVKTALGIILLIGSYATQVLLSSELIQNLIARELNEDPQDLFANWLRKQNIVGATTINVGWFLVVLGIINFVIAVGVWYKLRSIRSAGLLFFGVIGIFGTLHLYFRFSVLEFLGWIIDLLFLYYFWKTLPKYLGDIDSAASGQLE